MFTRFLVFLKQMIGYIRQKYSDVQLIDSVKWGIIILLLIFIIGKISTIAVWLFSIALIVFVGAKIYQKYFNPKE